MKRLIWTAVVLLVVLGAGYVLFVLFYSPDAQRADLEQRLSQAFGRPAHVGPMRLTFRGGLGIEARDVRVERDPSFGDGTVLEIDRVWADVGITDYLLRRKPAIEGLELERPRITLVKREDGVWNWSTLGGRGGARAEAATVSGGPLLAAAFAPSFEPSTAALTPSHVSASGAEVTLVDRTVSPPTETVYKNVALSTDLALSDDGTYHLNGHTWGDSGAAGGEPLAADLNFELTLMPPGSEAPSWRARGRVPSGRFATKNLRIDTVSSDVALDQDQVLRFDSLSAGMYGGTMTGAFALDLSTPLNRFTTSLEIKDVALGEALAPRPDLAGSLTGMATGTLQASGQLGEFNTTLASVSGQGHLVLSDAALTSVNLLKEITKQGGFTQVSFDEPETRAEKIEADLRIEQGRLFFHNASVSSVNGYANLRGGDGWVDIKKPASIKLDGSATLLPPLYDKIKQANPAAAGLVGMIQSRPNFQIPLTVTGPITQPDVSVHWGAVLNPGMLFGLPGPGAS